MTSPTRIRLGTAPIGNLFRAVSEADARAVLKASTAAGFVSLDTAPYYGHGLSETRIGAYLRETGMDLAISTKVGRRLVPCDGRPTPDTGFLDTPPFAPTFDLSRDGIRIALDDSFARLGVERVETLLLHDVGRMIHGAAHDAMLPQILDEALPAMRELRDAGLVGRIGLGVNEVEVVDELLPTGLIDVVLLAGRYTLIDRSAAALFDRCAELGIAVLAAGVYNSGILAGGETFNYSAASSAVRQRRDALAATCAHHGVPLAAAALRFALRHPAVEQVVVGMRTVDEVEDTANFLTLSIPDAMWDDLGQVGGTRC